jgi:hypothetical protein
VAEETGEEETIRCGWSGGAGAGGDKIGLGLAVRRAAYIAAVGWQAGPAGWALLGWAGPFLDITAIFPVGYISRVLIVSGYFSCRVRVNTTCRF